MYILITFLVYYHMQPAYITTIIIYITFITNNFTLITYIEELFII